MALKLRQIVSPIAGFYNLIRKIFGGKEKKVTIKVTQCFTNMHPLAIKHIMKKAQKV